MRIKPLKRYRKPPYPGLEDFRSDSESPWKCLPSRWKNDALIAGTLCALALSGCTGKAGQVQAVPGDTPSVSSTRTPARTGGIAPDIPVSSCEPRSGDILQKQSGTVAPLFNHGYGFVRSGGEAASFPAPLGEDEARQLIEGEFKKAGITFDRHNVIISGVTGEYKGTAKDIFGEIEPSNYRGPVGLDGYSSAHRFAYEYISSADESLYIKKGEIRSTAPPVAYSRPAAVVMEDLFTRARKVNLLIFYDPLDMKDNRGDLDASRKDLLAQVKDAIAWARNKGWIKK
ncbi:MAG: hypothetical protein RDV48_26310 [Candidatus Eremiobacteraeota bacterium]|nr:hypothetical protein [Candidatus Eremiobacteraeota bacterium]